ncbi:hypothetical protein HNP87_001820 [Methanococcus maripaludis]|uniref:Uncharacterized protein n=1 Tax=Methanococcus maripaludis TaxID=39152 RepID=A0A7J9NL51_METMI|nr:hypothetical protein [Methanococcus maripaludis]
MWIYSNDDTIVILNFWGYNNHDIIKTDATAIKGR